MFDIISKYKYIVTVLFGIELVISYFGVFVYNEDVHTLSNFDYIAIMSILGFTFICVLLEYSICKNGYSNKLLISCYLVCASPLFLIGVVATVTYIFLLFVWSMMGLAEIFDIILQKSNFNVLANMHVIVIPVVAIIAFEAIFVAFSANYVLHVKRMFKQKYK